MKKKTIVRIIISVFVSVQFVCCNVENKEGRQDDRLVDVPYNDSIMGVLIKTCLEYSDRNRNPEFDTTVYYVTFNFFTKNDTDKVWVMGNYNSPFVFHDISGNGCDKFIGYYKRNSVYCFIYKHLFEQSNGNILSENLQSYIGKSMRDWKRRNEKDNIDLFPEHWYDAIQDPYMFEYQIDSLGNYTLLRKGHW